MAQMRTGDVENGGSASTEALPPAAGGLRATGARAAADDQELARALRAPEQVGEGPGVADVAAVAQNHPAALIRNPYLSSEPNKIPLVIKGESPILAEAWWPISAGYQYGSGASSAGAPAPDSWALRGP